MPAETIPFKILQRAQTQPDNPAYHVRTDSGWQPTSWATYGDQVRAAAKSLLALGFEPRQKVSILGFNRPEWVIFDVAAMAAGGVPAGIYTTSSPAEVEYILNHSESPFILVEDKDQWEKVRQRRDDLSHLRHVVMMPGAADVDDPLVMSWAEFLAAGADVPDAAVQERLDGLAMDAVATMIYTSGTTGPPKAVMLSHDNLAWTSGQAVGVVDLGPEDRLLSYLPLSHIAEQMFTIHAPGTTGAQVYYARSIEQLRDDLTEVQPTVFFAVPRVWEKFYNGILGQMNHLEGPKARIAEWAQGVGRQVADARNRGDSPGTLLGVQAGLADRLVWGKVKEAIGMAQARVMVSGAAPVSKEILDYLAGFGLIVLEVYGQSEGSGPTTFNVPGRTKFGSVGPAYPGVEVRTADDGEILLQGRNVFLGYYKDEAATKETLADGWLYSGDLGEFDDDGFLSITGRKKDILITAGGKNVAPKPMEAGLKNYLLISEAVVVGDRRKYLAALVTLDPEEAALWAKERGLDGDLHEHPEVLAEVQRAVDEMNEHLARVEQIKRFTILPRELSIERGELTPTLKVKRAKVNELWADTIEALYAD